MVGNFNSSKKGGQKKHWNKFFLHCLRKISKPDTERAKKVRMLPPKKQPGWGTK